jgi:glycosyltransferase involved in cell wall biosynthesis
MTSGNDKPLLTLMVCAYNQEQFIREAVEGAFSQTYSPLEIILSDDCSKDRTFEIMREMAAAYRGPHRLILNRNATNLGLAGHSNRLAELAHGQLWVGAAGDDISFPNRVEIVYQAWQHSGRRAMGIQGEFIDIDDKGNIIGNPVNRSPSEAVTFREEKPTLEDYVHTLQPGIVGGAFAGHPLPYLTFGPLPSDLVHEDSVAALRAICLGSLLFVNAPLIKRRLHGNNMFSRRHELAASWIAVKQQEERMSRDARGRAGLYDAFLADLQVARQKELISNEQWATLKSACIYHRQLLSQRAEYASAGTARKFRILFSLRRARVDGAQINWMLLRLMPAPLFRSMKVMANSMRLALRTIFRSRSIGGSTG